MRLKNAFWGRGAAVFSRIAVTWSCTILHLTGLAKKKQKREDVQESETPDNKKAKNKPKTPHTVPKVKRVSESKLIGRRGIFAC